LGHKTAVFPVWYDPRMRDVIFICIHLFVTVFRIAIPGRFGRSLPSQFLLKHQLLILNRTRRRARNLQGWDRFIAYYVAWLLFFFLFLDNLFRHIEGQGSGFWPCSGRVELGPWMPFEPPGTVDVLVADC
jgi:hypothetical protein